METDKQMQQVLTALRKTRSMAIQTLRRDYPDLYELSIQAFEIKEAGSIDHHVRLGEFLTEWNNGLGTSPVEALATGRQEQVRGYLSDRSGTVLYEE